MPKSPEGGEKAPSEVEVQPDQGKNRARRLLIWFGSGLLVLALLFVLVVFVLPTPVARYAIGSQLERFGIQHDGIETIKFDLWNSKVSAGPVGFRSGEAEKGQIGETGFQYSFAALFEKRAFLQTFFLRGVDIHIDRLQDGSIQVNGIDLAEVMKPGDERAGQEETGSSFGLGVENFEFTDSRLVFEDFTGGSLAIEVEQLSLSALHTWDPNEEAIFELLGRFNEIDLAVSGKAKPLADPITFEMTSRLRGATIEKVAAFTGPTGLQRQAGQIDSNSNYRYVIHPGGLVTGKVEGRYQLEGFEIATATGESFTLEQAILQLDLEQEFRPDQSANFLGKLSLQTSPLSMTGANGDAIELEAIEFTIDDLRFNKLAERRVSEGEAAGGDSGDAQGARTVVQLLIGWAETVARNALQHHLEIDGRPALKLQGGLLRTAERDELPGQELRFGELTLNLGEIDSRTVGDGWTMTGALEAAIAAIRAASEGKGTEAQLAKIEVSSGSIELENQGTETSLSFDLAASLRELAVKNGSGLSLTLGSFDFGTSGMKAIRRVGGDELSGPLTLRLQDFAGVLPSDSADLRLAGEVFSLDLSSLSLSGEAALAAALAGRLEAKGLTAERGGEAPLSFNLAALRSELNDVRANPVSADAKLDAALSASLAGLRFNSGESDEELALSSEAIEIGIERLSAQGGAPPTLSFAGKTSIQGIETRLPFGADETGEAKIGNLDLVVSEVSASGPALRASGDLQAQDFDLQTSGGMPQSLAMDRLSVSGLNGDVESNSFEASAIAIEGLMATLEQALFGGDGESPGAEASLDESRGGEMASSKGAEAAEPPAQKLRVDDFTISPGSRIVLKDSSVDPPIELDIGVERLRIGPFDSGDPNIQTSVEVATSINEMGKADLQGWASPLKPQPDFDMASTVTDLSLPPFSPYLASRLGVVIDSGVASSDLKATSAGGSLEGRIDLLIDELYLEPVSEEEAKHLESSFGVPVGFAVGLLKDQNGRIDLGFPISGTLDAPEIDYSEAINKAVAGALSSILPTSWFGEDGRSYRMEPASFTAGTAELTDDGKSVADEIAELLASKPFLKVRACGKATANDLIVLRGGEAPSEAKQEPSDQPAPEGQGEALAKPTQEEVTALLALATQRGAAIRDYLSSAHGIDPGRLPECRTTYSIEDAKPPRAEFRF